MFLYQDQWTIWPRGNWKIIIIIKFKFTLPSIGLLLGLTNSPGLPVLDEILIKFLIKWLDYKSRELYSECGWYCYKIQLQQVISWFKPILICARIDDLVFVCVHYIYARIDGLVYVCVLFIYIQEQIMDFMFVHLLTFIWFTSHLSQDQASTRFV